jgi:myosin heavy subunit
LEAISATAKHWPDMWESMRKGALGFGLDMAKAFNAALEAEKAHTPVIRRTSTAVLELTETGRKLREGLAQLSVLWDKEAKAEEKAAAASEKHRQKLQALEKEFQRVEEAARKAAMEEEKAQLKAWADIDKAAAEHTRRMMAEDEKEQAATKQKFDQMAKAAEHYFQRVIDGVNRSSDTEVQQAQRVLDDTIAKRAQLVANHEVTNAQILQSDEAVAAAEKALEDAKLDQKITNFVTVADSASSILKSLFGKSKAAAIAAAIIDTISAIVKTMSAYPFPWSLIPAAAVAVAGYAQIAKIRSQEVGFALGTPGTSFVDFGRGEYRMLHGEEAVMTRGQAGSVASMVRSAIEDANRLGTDRAMYRPASREGEAAIILDGEVVGRWFKRRNRAGLLPVMVR